VVKALIEIVRDLSFMHMTPCGSDDSVDKLKSFIGMSWAVGRYWGLLLRHCYASDIMHGSIIREILKNSICACVGMGGLGGGRVFGYVHVYVSKALSSAESLDTSPSSVASRL
jgi:hypothetical protein